MKVSATLKNKQNSNIVFVTTNDNEKQIQIPSKENGFGSSVNGGELLLLSLATCFCNDIYREAHKRNLKITSVEVYFGGEFGAEGETGRNFQYSTIVKSDEPSEAIRELIKHTDQIAEIHNTLRKGINIMLKQ